MKVPQIPLLPGWRERIDRVVEEPPRRPILPKSPAFYAAHFQEVCDEPAARNMVELVRQRAIAYAGFNTAFCYGHPGMPMKRLGDQVLEWHDPRSVVPLLLSFAFWEPNPEGADRLYRFVVDLRVEAVREHVQAVLNCPFPFCCHFAPAELNCLWQLGLREPRTIWDTWVAQRVQLLGRHHRRNHGGSADDDAAAEDRAKLEIINRCDLLAVCRNHGIAHGFAHHKKAFQQSFLEMRNEAFTDDQLAYAVEDAVVAARLYPLQINEAVRTNTLDHLKDVEMPWTVTNARVIFDGVYACPDRLAHVEAACRQNSARLREELRALGVNNPNSPADVRDFMEIKGLLQYFRDADGYSFDDKHLAKVENLEPAAREILQYRQMSKLLNAKLFYGELVGADGRFHPDHRQLGAETLRNSMQWPNVGGIGKALRPLIVPQGPDMCIGEVDLSQIEVGIAAALSGDRQLIAMFNRSDVYSELAKQYLVGKLGKNELALPDKEFKNLHRAERELMKRCTLATIYDIGPISLAAQLACSPRAAERHLADFHGMFPELIEALLQAVEYGQIRGYAELVSGLRRYRGREGALTYWERRWLRNTPIQGSAGVVFKVAGNRLYQRYQHYGAKLILPLHDAYVFETPRKHLKSVAKITHDVMVSAVQEFFPQLNPHADINIDHPGAWTKDGKHRSLDLWCVHPDYAKLYLNS